MPPSEPGDLRRAGEGISASAAGTLGAAARLGAPEPGALRAPGWDVCSGGLPRREHFLRCSCCCCRVRMSQAKPPATAAEATAVTDSTRSRLCWLPLRPLTRWLMAGPRPTLSCERKELAHVVLCIVHHRPRLLLVSFSGGKRRLLQGSAVTESLRTNSEGILRALHWMLCGIRHLPQSSLCQVQAHYLGAGQSSEIKDVNPECALPHVRVRCYQTCSRTKAKPDPGKMYPEYQEK